ncbi:MAG: RHS repeat-associated core domain-containing protein, partial [Chloroflexota bacterium]
ACLPHLAGRHNNTTSWDRANRMLSMGSASYAYDGLSNRIQQTVSATVTNYLLDLQPGLATVLQATQGANTTRYVHAPRGIHAQRDASGNWEWMLQDGLGSVRGVVDNSVNPLESRLYEPYGVPFGTSGTSQTNYGFTGEMTDANNLLYLRARYYAPSLGVFTGLDPMENRNRYQYVSGNPVNGAVGELLSLNRYAYANGNPVNLVDPSGMQACLADFDCPVPSNPIIDWCSLYPNAFGCTTNGQPPTIPITPRLINPPNYGDFQPDQLWRMGTLLNGGPCNGIITLPGVTSFSITLGAQTSPQELERLRLACYRGDLRACETLRQLCAMSGNNNSDACTALERAKHGSCDPWTYEPLKATMEAACKSGLLMSCNADSLKRLRTRLRMPGQKVNEVVLKPEDIQQLIDNATNCINARQAIQDTCYRGQPDNEHPEQIRLLIAARILCETVKAAIEAVLGNSGVEL